MRPAQKIVAAGASTGILAMLVAMYLLSPAMPALDAAADAGERLAFAGKWLIIAALPLFLAVASVGNSRFLGEAIDPTAGKEAGPMIVDGRVADNTTQQLILFTCGLLGLSASLRGDQLGMVSAAATIFLVARLLFWVGYRINPLYRAFGMSSTAYLVLLTFLLTAWFSWT